MRTLSADDVTVTDQPVFTEAEAEDRARRILTTQLKDMVKAGFRIANLPTIDIEADNEKEAKELVLLISSRYGKVTDDGLYEFIVEGELNFDELREMIDLPEIDLNSFRRGYMPEAGEGEKEIGEIETSNKCPRCGYEW